MRSCFIRTIPRALVSLARSRFRAPSDAASRSSAASRRPSRPGLLRPRSRRMPEAVRAPRSDQEKASAPRGNRSLALPDRLALLHERLHALAEVAAHVAEADEVGAFLREHAIPDAPQRLLGGLERERCVRRDHPRELIDASCERIVILRDLVVQADAQGLVGVDKTSGEDDLLHARDADERGKSHEVRHRAAIAEPARDRYAESRGWRC